MINQDLNTMVWETAKKEKIPVHLMKRKHAWNCKNLVKRRLVGSLDALEIYRTRNLEYMIEWAIKDIDNDANFLEAFMMRLGHVSKKEELWFKVRNFLRAVGQYLPRIEVRKNSEARTRT